jgi:hypothetical protein
VLVRLGVLAMLVRRQLIGGRMVVGCSMASVVLMSCHVASPGWRWRTPLASQARTCV